MTDNNSSPEEVIRRTQLGIARLRESQRQLVRDIQDRYDELGQAVDQLRSFFNGDNMDEPQIIDAKTAPTDETMNEISRPLSIDAVRFIQDRQYGFRPRSVQSARHSKFLQEKLPDFVSQHVPAILSEKELDLGTMNKVFASEWLNDSQVVMGTKCNKLNVIDVRNNNTINIPSLKSSPASSPADCPCGIHGISINPSRTLLATGASHTNDLAVYQLPTFDAFCVGEGAHKDWIFDMDFIDDTHIVTGSRDSTVALWRLSNQESSTVTTVQATGGEYPVIKPLQVQTCKNASRVRALGLSKDKRLMGVLSMDAKFHYWDVGTFKQLDTLDLPWRRENVCVTSSDNHSVFAIGSEAYVTLLDHRKPVKRKRRGTQKVSQSQFPAIEVPARRNRDRRAYSWPSKGIRSLSFNGNIVTIGTGDGRLVFYDMRNKNFLQPPEGNPCELQVGEGWLRNDSNFREHFQFGYYPNAIYTHCYDSAKARIFAAGGPLPAGLYGNYAGLFC